MTSLILNPDYQNFLKAIKQNYQQSQLKAAFAVNTEMIRFYWQLGQMIIEKQQQAKWGSKFLDQLSKDLQSEFSGASGFSKRNLERMKQFASLYDEATFATQPVSQIPWGHIIVLMQQVKDPQAREWYVNSILRNGTSRNVLAIQIEQNLYERQGKDNHKKTNFADRLPSPQSDLATQLFKDPYDFRFLPVTDEAEEMAIEKSMVNHISKLLLELGGGFAYMGNQYKITIEGEDYFLDMLFYNVQLRCFFVIELKSGTLKPEHVGKLNFYLAVVDDLLRKSGDNPSIGLLLCKKNNKVVAEYSLKKTDGAIGIAEYLLMNQLPNHLKQTLPDIAILETKLSEPLEKEISEEKA